MLNTCNRNLEMIHYYAYMVPKYLLLRASEHLKNCPSCLAQKLMIKQNVVLSSMLDI